MRLVTALLLTLLAAPALAQPADLVLRGGNIITVDNDWHVAQAVAVRGGRFVAIGDDAVVGRYVGANTQVIKDVSDGSVIIKESDRPIKLNSKQFLKFSSFNEM